MNGLCYGNWFRVESDLFYECMLDGTVNKITNGLCDGYLCPTCNRKIVGTQYGNPPIKITTIKQVVLGCKLVTFSELHVDLPTYFDHQGILKVQL